MTYTTLDSDAVDWSGPRLRLASRWLHRHARPDAAQLPTMQPGWEKATFAMGCFWSAESDFDKLAGVKFTTSGYTGGRVSNPSYEQVARGSTGHAEAIEVAFDPAVVPYEEVLEYFWRHVDPFVAHRQFCDVGQQYRPEIFVHSDAQRAAGRGVEEARGHAIQRSGHGPDLERSHVLSGR